MTDTRTKEVFFPYIFGEETLVLELVHCELDGKSINAIWNSESMECDLTAAEPWVAGVLKFKISRDPSSMSFQELLPAHERESLPIRLIATAHCGATFRREKCEGTLHVKSEQGEITVPLIRAALAGSVDLDVFVVRASPQSTDPHLASDAAARIIAARRGTIRIDSSARRSGPGLKIEWESFKTSKHRYRAAHGDVLFHLDTAGAEPILFLNKDADPDVHAIMTEEAPRGRKAAIRNLLFAAIAIPVWMCLLRTAITFVDTDGHIDAGWQRNVLLEVATVANPQCDVKEALRLLISDLRDRSGGRGIEEKLPVIIAELVDFRKKAEQSAGVLL